MKIIRKLFFFLGIFFLVLAVLLMISFVVIKHLKVKEIIESQIEQSLGIGVSIGAIEFSPLLAHIEAKSIIIDNPSGFPEEELAYIDTINFLIDPIEVAVSKKPNIYVLGVDLKRLNIIKNKEGAVNIEAVCPLKDKDAVLQDKTPFYFDLLVLSVGSVRFVDYSGPVKKEHVYPINLKNATFINLRDEQDVVRLVVSKAIENTDIGKIINLKIVPVVSQINETFHSAWGTAKTGVKGAWGIAALPFKILFGKN